MKFIEVNGEWLDIDDIALISRINGTYPATLYTVFTKSGIERKIYESELPRAKLIDMLKEREQ